MGYIRLLLALVRTRKDKSELEKFILAKNPQNNADVDNYTREYYNARSAWWAI